MVWSFSVHMCRITARANGLAISAVVLNARRVNNARCSTGIGAMWAGYGSLYAKVSGGGALLHNSSVKGGAGATP